MIGFISTLVKHSHLITLKYMPYSDIADLHTLNFTVAYALGFPVSTSRLLETDLNTGIIQVSQNYTLPIPLHDSTHKVSTSHLKSSQVDELSSSTMILHFNSLIPPTLNRELTSRGCLLPRTLNSLTQLKTITSNHTIRSSPTMNLPQLSTTENYL
jgi:hypothetical protein